MSLTQPGRAPTVATGDLPRTLLFTGKGGVGKTTVAAATAVHAARSGRKTLVLSTDAAHSLADALGHPLDQDDGEPVEVEAGLYALHVDPRGRLERHWRGVQAHLLHALDELGVDPAAAEEMTVLPAAEEVLALLEVRDQVRAGRWDLVVVDCAPTAETLRLLALPEALSLYLERAVPVGRRVARAVRSGLAGGPDPVLVAMQRLAEELAEVQQVLTAPSTSVRIVLTPETVVLAEARRSLTSLALFGYPVDAAVVNRLVPDGEDAWLLARGREQSTVLAAVDESFAGIPVHRCGHVAVEPVGTDALADLAALLYGDPAAGAPGHDPLDVTEVQPALRVERSGEALELVLALPLVDRSDVALTRRGDELVVVVGASRRVLALPSALRRCRVTGARLREGSLRVRFEPDPELWRPL